MRKRHGFTLIELLIVVAIIAILAAIAVPNFLEAQVRSKVSRVRSDHRSLATAIEAYYVDNNTYPAAAMVGGGTNLPSADEIVNSNGGRTFALRRIGNNNLSSLTTPIAYITSYFADPFAETRGLPFRYYATRQGWILGSFGPNTNQAAGGNLGWRDGTTPWPGPGVGGDAPVETVYDPVTKGTMPSSELIAGASTTGSFTYDPTNGTVSPGDVWRVRQ